MEERTAVSSLVAPGPEATVSGKPQKRLSLSVERLIGAAVLPLFSARVFNSCVSFITCSYIQLAFFRWLCTCIRCCGSLFLLETVCNTPPHGRRRSSALCFGCTYTPEQRHTGDLARQPRTLAVFCLHHSIESQLNSFRGFLRLACPFHRFLRNAFGLRISVASPALLV